MRLSLWPLSATVVPQELKKVQHLYVCWVLGSHGRRCPFSQPEGQRGPGFGKERPPHAQHPSFTGDMGNDMLLFLGHTAKDR